MELDKLNTSLIQSLSSDHLKSITSDSAEVIFDSFLKDGVLKDIPVFGTILNVAKLGIGLREQFFAKKIFKFLIEVSDVSIEERKKFVSEIEKKDELKQRVGETLIILIDRLDHLEKPKIIGQLLKAKMNGGIELTKFLRLSSIIERAFLYDLYELVNYANKSVYQEDISESLEKLGLVYNSVISGGGTWVGEENTVGMKYSITNLGMDLLKYGLAKK